MANSRHRAARQDRDVDDMHLEQGGHIGFTENPACLAQYRANLQDDGSLNPDTTQLYAEFGAMSTPLNHGAFGPALQGGPYSYSNTNNSGLLPDSFFGLQLQGLDTEVQASPWGPGSRDEQNGQVPPYLISGNFVSQSPSSLESPNALGQIFSDPLFSRGHSGEAILSTPFFPSDLSGTGGFFVNNQDSLVPLNEAAFTGIESYQDYNCFDNLGWCPNPIKPLPTNIAPKSSATTTPDMTSGTPSSHTIPPQEPLPVAKRKRSQFDDEGKTKVKKCNEEIPCMNCVKVKDKQKVYRGPCIRPNIFDVQSFRAGDGDNGQLRSILPEYKWIQGSKTMMVKLEWPFRRAHANKPILEVACQMFKPMRGQNTAEEFSINDTVRQVNIPPWACRDTEAAQRDISRFLGESQALLEEEIRMTLEDNIMRHTWVEALRYRATHKSTLVTRALQVFAGAMMNSRYPMSLEANVFGIPDELDNTPHFFKNLPLPAQLTYQIQTMVAHEMLDTQASLLKELKGRIFHKERQLHWYEVYLTVFILLASIEFVYGAQMRFVRAKAGISDRNLTNIAFVTQAMLDEWESSARNLINHFRCVMTGDLPFGQSWEEGSDNHQRTRLDAEAVRYIRAMQREIEARMDELRKLRELEGRMRFEEPLGAICELFLPSEA
ncbi:hypothetical protein F5X98DRAFT_391563 [Xylaria grammica]|nr:hypothetical protein F5X98DRAFT_391563 [Xylaria grammica]